MSKLLLFYISSRVMLSTAELHWESSGFSTALPVLLQALALARQHHLQSLASEAILHLAFTQVGHNRRTDFPLTLIWLPSMKIPSWAMADVYKCCTAIHMFYLFFSFLFSPPLADAGSPRAGSECSSWSHGTRPGSRSCHGQRPRLAAGCSLSDSSGWIQAKRTSSTR